jgi:hypothetical protein
LTFVEVEVDYFLEVEVAANLLLVAMDRYH